MPIRFSCEHCGQKLSVSSRKAGVVAKCPKCRQRIQVPENETAPAAAGDDPAASSAAAGGGPPPVSGDEDPYLQFTVYDEDVEWEYEDDAAAIGPPTAEVDLNKVAVPRGVLYAQGILLAVVALIAFLFGILIGGRGSNREAVQAPAGPCTIRGQVLYQTDGLGDVPDEGTVVIVLPQNERPGVNERAPVEGLRPGDPLPAENNPGLRAIRVLGGDYTRVDANGDFSLRVPDAGDYFLLAVSRNKYRGEDEAPVRADLAQLGRYFLPATDLLGNSKYQWQGVTIRRDETLDIAF